MSKKPSPSSSFLERVHSLRRMLLANKGLADRTNDSQHDIATWMSTWLRDLEQAWHTASSREDREKIDQELKAAENLIKNIDTLIRQHMYRMDQFLVSYKLSDDVKRERIIESQCPVVDDVLSDHQKFLLKSALIQIGYLTEESALPKIERAETGISGQSSLLFFTVEYKGVKIPLVAKYVDGSAIAQEWTAYQELLKFRPPEEILLPINCHSPKCIIPIFQVVPNAIRLSDYLLRHMKSRYEQCAQVLDHGFNAIRWFYDLPGGNYTGTIDKRHASWKDSFQEYESRRDEILANPAPGMPEVDRSQPNIHFPQISDHPFPNPFEVLDRLYNKPTGKVRISRIHRDPNLTNFLVDALKGELPRRVVVIDPVLSLPEQTTAWDLAFFETQFWLDVFPGFSRKSAKEEKVLGGFLRILSYLNGEASSLGVSSMAVGNCADFIKHFRERHARGILAPPRRKRYDLRDFYICMAFHFIEALRFDQVRQCSIRTKMAVIGSAMALKAVGENGAS